MNILTRRSRPLHQSLLSSLLWLACVIAPNVAFSQQQPRLATGNEDQDHDSVPDSQDQCPLDPAGQQPDPQRLGCPAASRDPAGDDDGDNVSNAEDLCPAQSAGNFPDSNRRGCPEGDRDHDSVPDRLDACPGEEGIPSPNASRNGCPASATMSAGQLVPDVVLHLTGRGEQIDAASLRQLGAIRTVLRQALRARGSSIIVVSHTDSRGSSGANQAMSQRRAELVMRWLATHGIPASRLEAQGLGESSPIGNNATADGRAQNSRVEFRLISQ